MTQESKKYRWNIVDGPSKLDIMLALFDRKIPGKEGLRLFSFKVKLEGRVYDCECNLMQAKAADESGDRWFLEGDSNIELTITGYVAYYDIKTRKGYLTR